MLQREGKVTQSSDPGPKQQRGKASFALFPLPHSEFPSASAQGLSLSDGRLPTSCGLLAELEAQGGEFNKWESAIRRNVAPFGFKG
jgi:hypothetical protein